MIAAELEERICKALAAAFGGVPAARRPVVRGTWSDAAEGRTGPELQPTGTLVAVAVGLPAYERPMLNKATLAVRVTTWFRNASSAAAATTVIPMTEAICRLVGAWQMDAARLEADLGFAGFRPFALRGGGGTAPTETADGLSVTHEFTVTGLTA